MRRFIAAVLCVPAIGACLFSCPPAHAAEKSSIGMSVADFTLRDFRGKEHALADFDEPVIVVAFLGTECPLVKLYVPRLVQLAERLEGQGVAVIGVNSNVQDTPTEMDAFARRYGVHFTLLKDTANRVADQFGAQRTPEVFVLDAARTVRYRGRIDDQYTVGFSRAEASRHDLAAAVEELLAGKEVSIEQTEAPGCLIGKVRIVEPTGNITFTEHISRLMNRRCVECHREGEIGPFPLASYDDVSAWAETMLEVVEDGRMPPWFADPRYGHFANDAALTADEKAHLRTWVENGCPQGDPAHLPEPVQFEGGWRIGEPDVVYHMEEAFEVPAEGTVDYQYFTIDPGLEEDIWVTAAQARPDDYSVVHHIVLFAAPKGARARRGGFGQMVAIYAPGMPPWNYPEGTAMRIRAGSQFVIQMHYTPNGTPTSDRSYVGLKLVDEQDVKREIRYGMALNVGFEIPPHAADHVVRSAAKFRRDTMLLNLFPHMHYRGKAFRFEAEYPDGSREVLLDVPRYDFNWQLRYDLAEPKLLPGGTVLRCEARYDNSAENLRNPAPDQSVRFGLQSYEEMMIGYYTTVAAEAADSDPEGD